MQQAGQPYQAARPRDNLGEHRPLVRLHRHGARRLRMQADAVPHRGEDLFDLLPEQLANAALAALTL